MKINFLLTNWFFSFYCDSSKLNDLLGGALSIIVTRDDLCFSGQFYWDKTEHKYGRNIKEWKFGSPNFLRENRHGKYFLLHLEQYTNIKINLFIKITRKIIDIIKDYFCI